MCPTLSQYNSPDRTKENLHFRTCKTISYMRLIFNHAHQRVLNMKTKTCKSEKQNKNIYQLVQQQQQQQLLIISICN